MTVMFGDVDGEREVGGWDGVDVTVPGSIGGGAGKYGRVSKEICDIK